MRRILCIDGGGIKGTQPAAFLAGLEEDLDEPIGRYFDLIAGTSTGGILAIGLALGIPAKTLLELYENRGPTIFGQACQSALKFDPLSASNIDPLGGEQARRCVALT